MRNNSFPKSYDDYSIAKQEYNEKMNFYKKLKNMKDAHSVLPNMAIQEIDFLWNKLTYCLNFWLWSLDSNLSNDFGFIGKWMSEAEKLLLEDNIPTEMNEETASIISRKLEEHKQFFSSTPQIIEMFEFAKHSEAVNKISKEQLVNLEQRLYGVNDRAAQRRIYLKFLEHKCCLIAFLNLIESKLNGWTGKYGRENDVQQLIEQYRNFISRNKVFQEFNKAFIDMQQVVDEYKRDGDSSKRDNAEIDKFMGETDARWKTVSMELRCVHNMLEEVVINWKRWTPLLTEFENWICKAEENLKLSEDDRLEFFQDISVWKDKYQLLGDTGNFLIATTNKDIGAEIKFKYMNLTERWEKLFANTKQYMHSGEIVRNRQEFRRGLAKLNQWLDNAEQILLKQPIATSEEIKIYIDELQGLQNGIENIEELFKNISKVFQTLITDLSRDEVDKMMNLLKKEKERLVRTRAQITSKLNLFHQLSIQQESLEAGRKEIHAWLDEAESLLGSLTLNCEKDKVQTQSNAHKTFFSRSLYYKSMLESKNKVFLNLLKSVDNDKSINISEAKDNMEQLNKRFNYVLQNAQQWEYRLKETVRCWNNYNECEYLIVDWINRAETLLNENIPESKKSIETQKLFFENVNERWLNNFIQAANDLDKCIPQSEDNKLMENAIALQEKWKKYLAYAPLHLQKLEFRLEEHNFNQYLGDIENEIHLEQQSLNRNEDIDIILKRNENYFKTKGIIVKIEKCLENMKRNAVIYSDNDPSDNSLNEVLDKSLEKWENVTDKIDSLRRVLQQIPIQWNTYHKKFIEIEHWMDTVDKSLQNILSDVNTMEEFEKERIVFQVNINFLFLLSDSIKTNIMKLTFMQLKSMTVILLLIR